MSDNEMLEKILQRWEKQPDVMLPFAGSHTCGEVAGWIRALRAAAASAEPVAAPPVVAWECTDDRYPAIKGIVTDSHGTVDAWLQSGIEFACLGRIITRPASAPDAEIVAALEAMLDEYDRNVCEHEITHRGGHIWTICDGCGRKWADDEGGFVPHVDPPHVIEARAALAKAKGGPRT